MRTLSCGLTSPFRGLAAFAFLTVGCAAGDATLSSAASSGAALEVEVRVGQTHQLISGFGGSSAWHSTPPSDAQADQLFSVERGAGLSLHRIRIAPDGTTWELATAHAAQQRGARVWAAPWSPPGAWKSNGRDTNGGRLLPTYYPAWADRLADFARSMGPAGIRLAYLSVQNEPSWVADWETCEWSPSELLVFVRDYLGPALAARGVAVPLLAPESNDWIVLRSFADPLLADPAAAALIGVIAVHAYGGSPYPYPAPAEAGKELWQTEWSASTVGPGMASGLEVARSIHDHLTLGDVNAWHYWWVTDSASSSAGALIQAGVVTKRLWAMGNYSRFVRPGSFRVGAALNDGGGTSNVFVTAFRIDTTGTLAVVAVNQNAVAVPLRVVLADAQVGAVTPWVTSESFDLAPQPSLTGGSTFSYELPAASVTTLVGAGRF